MEIKGRKTKKGIVTLTIRANQEEMDFLLEEMNTCAGWAINEGCDEPGEVLLAFVKKARKECGIIK